MLKKTSFKSVVLFSIFLITGILFSCSDADPNPDRDNNPPNIVLIFFDDAGWGDFQPFTETRYPTPKIRSLAEEGRSFYNFYVASAVCSASRAALMTGTYPGRNGLFGAHGPRQKGLNPDFVTIGEMLQEEGYRTASFGKWHLGDQPETRPPERGFNSQNGFGKTKVDHEKYCKVFCL